MPRDHKRRLGANRYHEYSEEDVKKAVMAVQDGMSRRAAEIEFKIPRTTLSRRLIGDPVRSPGRPPVLTAAEEDIILARIDLMCAWGFPLDGNDLRYLVKSYLDRRGVNVVQFKNNLPGYEFVYHFKKRHPQLTSRFAGNIKRSRAKVSHADLNDYFNNLEKELDGMLPDCIFNYDETNLSDDPGRKKCLMKRGTKYPERILNHSKACTSLMFCGSAAGQLLPMYVVYKAKNVYQGWMERGPENARYSCTTSGWFDGETFTDWFRKVFIPVAKRKPTTALIGDNLSSHFSSEVLDLCEKHNVKFICLPPNSTDKTQPLDVSFFAPLKRKWRQLLNSWKSAHPKESTVPKTVFPKLLKELVGEMNKENLVSGFKKCGIYPLNREEVLSRVPDAERCKEANEHVDAVLIDMLNTSSGKDGSGKKTRGSKVSFNPGKSISASATAESSSSSDQSSSEEELDNDDEDCEGSDADDIADADNDTNKENEKPDSAESESDSGPEEPPEEGTLKVPTFSVVS